MSEELKVLISTDTTQAQAGLNQLNTALTKSSDQLKVTSNSSEKLGLSLNTLTQKVASFGGGVKSFTSAFTGLGSSLRVVPPAANSTAASLQKLTTSSSQATGAMVNLGRVVQDAPFGFIGIANNLNPLLESFQRLKTSTGSSGAAFKALGKELTGAGGVGLALSVVSSLAIVFGDKLFGASKASKEASKQAKDHADTLKNAFASVAEEAGRVETLIHFIKLETTSRKERVNAIKELQSVAPGYFAMLDAEKASINQVTGAYNLYVVSLRKAVEAKVTEKQLNDVIEKRLGLERSLGKPLYENVLINGKMVRVQNAIYDSGGQIKKQEEDLVKLRNEELFLADKLAKLQPPKLTTQDFKAKPIKDNTSQIIALAKRINEAYEDTIDLKLGIKPEDEVKAQLKKATDYLKKYKAGDFKLINLVTKVDLSNIEIPPIDQLPTDLRTEAQRLSDMFGTEFTKFLESKPVDASLNAKIKLDAEIEEISKKSDLAGGLGPAFEKLFSEQFEAAWKMKIKPEMSAEDMKKIGEGLFLQFKLGAIAIEEATKNFNSFVDAIFAGENAFESFGEFVKNSLRDVAKQIIKTAILAGILSALSGGSLNFIGALSKISGFGGFRAGGGPVSAGKTYLVGEKEAEFFTPNTSGMITPLSALKNLRNPFEAFKSFSMPSLAALPSLSMDGMRNISPAPTQDIHVHLDGAVKGNDIILAVSRAIKAQRRGSGGGPGW